jgi:hypothetical protein
VPETADNGVVAAVSPVAIGIALAGWLVPGLGHVLLKRWGRGALIFLAVGALALTGFLMRGNVFAAHASDIFDFFGYLGDLGSGVFYLLAKVLEPLGPDVSRAAGDYGTRFIAAAGILNVLSALDAYEIACGMKD